MKRLVLNITPKRITAVRPVPKLALTVPNRAFVAEWVQQKSSTKLTKTVARISTMLYALAGYVVDGYVA